MGPAWEVHLSKVDHEIICQDRHIVFWVVTPSELPLQVRNYVGYQAHKVKEYTVPVFREVRAILKNRALKTNYKLQ